MGRIVVGVAVGVFVGALVFEWYRKNKAKDKTEDQDGRAPGPTEYDVILRETGEGEIKVIRVIREATGLDLKAVKALLENLPTAIKESLSETEADLLAKAITNAGGLVELKPQAAFS